MPSTEVDLRDSSPTGVEWARGERAYKIGCGGITFMRVVRIPGPMGFHPWIEVYRDDTLVARVNCCEMEEISYDN